MSQPKDWINYLLSGTTYGLIKKLIDDRRLDSKIKKSKIKEDLEEL